MKSIVHEEIDRNTLKAEQIAPFPIKVNCDEDVNYWWFYLYSHTGLFLQRLIISEVEWIISSCCFQYWSLNVFNAFLNTISPPLTLPNNLPSINSDFNISKLCFSSSIRIQAYNCFAKWIRSYVKKVSH